MKSFLLRASMAVLSLFAIPLRAVEEPELPALPPILDLETAQRIALQENPSLQAAAARVKRAKARVQQANAAFFPTIGLRGSAVYTRLSDRTVTDFEQTLNPIDEDTAGQLDEAFRDTVLDLSDAGQNAQLQAQAKQLERLRDRPILYDLQKKIFESQNTIQQDYANALRSEVDELSPVQSLLDGLGLDSRPTVDQTLENYSVGASASWVLFDGFSRVFARSLARHGKEESESARLDARRLLLGAVATAFYQAQLSREEINIARANLDFNSRLLTEAETTRQSGKGTLSTVLNFQVRRNVAETEVLVARQQFDTYLLSLSALMGLPQEAKIPDLELVPPDRERPEQLAPPAAEERIAYALTHRPDLELAQARLDQAREGIRLARSAYSPSLNMVGNYGANRPDDLHFDNDDLGGVGAVVLTFPLFEGGARRARVREAFALREEASHALDQVRLDIVIDVRTSHLNVTSAGNLLQLERRNLELIQRTRNLVELEYKASHTSLVRLNEAQRDLVQARSRHARSLAALHVAWHQLQQATAQSLDSFAYE